MRYPHFTRRLLVVLPSVLMCLIAINTASAIEHAKAKHVFYFIGDGMGSLQREVGEQCLKGITQNPDATLLMNQLPVQGFLQTRSANKNITDSAAAGTALATGYKTNNTVVGLLPDMKTPVPSIAELAHQHGLKVGILTSVTLDNATPACFFAHQAKRSHYYPISVQLANAPFAYFAGGGLQGLEHNGDNNLELAKTNGFVITQSRKQLAEQRPGTRVIALNESDKAQHAALPWEVERKDSDISLAQFVEQGIRLLDNDKGFFMMIEGGKIDWAGHDNAIGTLAREVVALDETLKVAMKFYKQHPNDTLIIITADHETGGMQKIGKPDPQYLANFTASFEHFKFQLIELIKNKATYEQAFALAQSQFRLDPLTEEQALDMQKGWALLLDSAPIKFNYKKYNPFIENCLVLAARKAGYQFTTHGHSNVDVPISAIGVGSDWFKGTQDNTVVTRYLYQLITGKPFSVLQEPGQ